MKGKKLVAAIACTALVAAVAVPLAGCGGLGETTLDVSKYAEEYTATPNAAITSLSKVVSLNNNEDVYCSFGDMLVVRSYSSYNYIYKAINIKTGATVVFAASECGYDDTYVGNSWWYYIYLTDSNNNRTYYGQDGTLLISGVTSATVSYNSPYLTVTGTSAQSGEIVKKYKVDTSSSPITLTTETGDTSSDASAIGDDKNGLKESIYDKDVKSDIAGYSVLKLGYTYYFYDGNGNLKSTLDIENGSKLDFVGNYMYYMTSTPVDSEKTSGYNFMYNSGYGSNKTKVSLHKYDILNGKDSEVKVDLVIAGLEPLYNKDEKAYDAAVIYGYKMKDGVATVGYNEFAYVVDADLKVAYDISWYAQASSSSTLDTTLSGLSGGYYKLGNYVVDGSLNPVNSYSSSSSSYFNEGLIDFTENGKKGFTNIEGKVVITADYQSVGTFYGGYAYALKALSNGTPQKVLLNKNGGYTVLPEGANIGNGYYYVENNGAYTFYNFTNISLMKLDSSYSVSFETYGSYNCVTATKNSTTDIYKFA